jgi:pSer/pThr/pTyr-binding forkhead associated (FHA) protein
MPKLETRRMESEATSNSNEDFLAKHRATLVIVSGDAAGVERSLDSPVIVVGRGPDVDISFDDDAMSRSHAAFELIEGGFRIRDLGSTNGVILNGGRTQTAELKHGDRLMLGRMIFTYLVEQRRSEPRTYVLPEI